MNTEKLYYYTTPLSECDFDQKTRTPYAPDITPGAGADAENYGCCWVMIHDGPARLAWYAGRGKGRAIVESWSKPWEYSVIPLWPASGAVLAVIHCSEEEWSGGAAEWVKAIFNIGAPEVFERPTGYACARQDIEMSHRICEWIRIHGSQAMRDRLVEVGV